MKPVAAWIAGAALAAQCGFAVAQDTHLGDAERLRRDAESPLRWIRVHAETPARPAAAASAPAAPARRPPSRGPVKSAAAKSEVVKTEPAKAEVAKPAAPTSDLAARPPDAPASRPAEPARAALPELVLREQAAPDWDEAVLRTLRRGRVALAFEVDTDGRIRNAAIAESSDARLNDAALAAIGQWRFEPPAQPRKASIEFGFDRGP